MASDSIFAGPRAAFGPESRPLDWNKQGMGAGDIGGLEMAGGGGARFAWGVSVEVPSKSPSAAESACSSAGDNRRVRGPSRSQSSASVVIGGASAGSTAPVDDPVVVKNLTSQVGGLIRGFCSFGPSRRSTSFLWACGAPLRCAPFPPIYFWC